MYQQVKIPICDRDALRFLWTEDGKIVEYRMTSHLFGGVWCPSSSIFALRHNNEDFPTSSLIKETAYKSFYVDDLLKAVQSKEQAMEVIIGTKEVLRQGGFNLTKFVVNNAELQQFIPVEDRAKEMKDITSGIYSKALGIRWDVLEDTLYFSNLPKQVESCDDVTKRSMLSKLSAIYDPLGLITPILMQGKMMFQEATLYKLAWDEVFPLELREGWSRWLRSLEEIKTLKFPRCVIPPESVDGAIELHFFCDASQKGYGVWCYIRIINAKGKVRVNY